ncbi:MAG: sigma-70 family RNA polymerase sigma factor [Bacteroidota bacterium]
MHPSGQEKFIELVEAHQGLLNQLCRVYFSRMEDQMDARQEVLLQLWKAFPNFRGDSKFSTWMYKVALRTILTKVRNNQKHRSQVALQNADRIENPPHFLVDDDLQLLKQLLNCLSANDKALVILYLEGYHHEEISTMLNVSVSNVGTRLHRIKNKLKANYKTLLP